MEHEENISWRFFEELLEFNVFHWAPDANDETLIFPKTHRHAPAENTANIYQKRI